MLSFQYCVDGKLWCGLQISICWRRWSAHMIVAAYPQLCVTALLMYRKIVQCQEVSRLIKRLYGILVITEISNQYSQAPMMIVCHMSWWVIKSLLSPQRWWGHSQDEQLTQKKKEYSTTDCQELGEVFRMPLASWPQSLHNQPGAHQLMKLLLVELVLVLVFPLLCQTFSWWKMAEGNSNAM